MPLSPSPGAPSGMIGRRSGRCQNRPSRLKAIWLSTWSVAWW